MVVKGNPLFDVVALSNLDLVVKDGVAFKDGANGGNDEIFFSELSF
jgi:hypothetical protein